MPDQDIRSRCHGPTDLRMPKAAQDGAHSCAHAMAQQRATRVAADASPVAD